MTSNTMSKAEAVEFLGISERTLERYSKQGKLNPIYLPGEKAKEVYYRTSEIEILKFERSLPIEKVKAEVDADTQTLGLSDAPESNNLQVINLLSSLIERLVAHHIARSPLEDFKQLEEICNNEWALPTSKMAELLGIKTTSLTRHNTMSWGGFEISRGGRWGRELAWRVTRQKN